MTRTRRASGALARGVLVWAACGLVAGCIPDPPGGVARAARTDVPATFGGESTEATEPGSGAESGAGAESGSGAESGAGADTEPSSARADWHELFGDPQLVALIDIALQNNQELNIAIQEMIVANSDVMARRGDILPSLSLGAGGGLERAGRYTSQGQSDEANGVAADLQDYSIGLYASWEIDVWGRLRDTADASMYRYLASAEGRNFMVTRLVAEIANRYFELLALDREQAILEDNIRLQEDALRMVQLQQQAARVTMLAVTRFDAQLRGFQSRRYEIAQRIVETENQLNLLLGRFPQHVERRTDEMLAITPPVVHAGAPSELLESRPDVRQAERELTASQLDVSAARAAFYPRIGLDLGVGLRSFDITTLVTSPDSLIYRFLGGIAAPLLNRSGLTADYYAANAQQMHAVLRYERTILSAFVDVSSALALVRNLGEAYTQRTEQVERLRESVELSTMLFSAARADYLEVLTTRRDYLEAQMELVETKQRQLSATVTLYQALGGGWRIEGAPADPEPMGAQP